MDLSAGHYLKFLDVLSVLGYDQFVGEATADSTSIRELISENWLTSQETFKALFPECQTILSFSVQLKELYLAFAEAKAECNKLAESISAPKPSDSAADYKISFNGGNNYLNEVFRLSFMRSRLDAAGLTDEQGKSLFFSMHYITAHYLYFKTLELEK